MNGCRFAPRSAKEVRRAIAYLLVGASLEVLLISIGAMYCGRRIQRGMVYPVQGRIAASDAAWIFESRPLWSTGTYNARGTGIGAPEGPDVFWQNGLGRDTELFKAQYVVAQPPYWLARTIPSPSGVAVWSEWTGFPLRCAYWRVTVDDIAAENGLPRVQMTGLRVTEKGDQEVPPAGIVLPTSWVVEWAALNVLFMAMSIAVPAELIHYAHRRRRVRRRLCVNCGYSIVGVVDRHCPECGSQFVVDRKTAVGEGM